MPDAPYAALYVHVPFCVRRCAYCDFATEAIPASSAAVKSYFEELVLAVMRAGRAGELACIQTVYVGGGTPTHVGPQLTELLYALSLSMSLSADVECTVEANPESLTPALVRDVWALGANRISLGVQSFEDGVLDILGRAHTADQARRAIAVAHERFENVSIDLMCGLPGQSIESFARDVELACNLGVAHVSVYPLSLEQQTPLAFQVESGAVALPGDDEVADMMCEAACILRTAGFERYEVASYCKPGFACRHNQAYWTGLPYLGLGRSAVSMHHEHGARLRLRDGQVEERIEADEVLIEDLMLGMRMSCGVSADDVVLADRVLGGVAVVFDDLVSRGLVRRDGARFVPTERGWLLGNELYGAILSCAVSGI